MTEKERIEKLLRSMACIEVWANNALNHSVPFGNDYRRALSCIQREAQAAIEKEGGAE